MTKKKLEGEELTKAAKENIEYVVKRLERHEKAAIPALREEPTTAAGACFRRVEKLLKGKEKKR